jgi:hypothetical protein
MIGVQTGTFIALNLFSIKASGKHSVYTIAKAIYGSSLFLLPALIAIIVSFPGGTTNVQTSGFHSVVRSATSSQGIRGYIFVMFALMFDVLLNIMAELL